MMQLPKAKGGAHIGRCDVTITNSFNVLYSADDDVTRIRLLIDFLSGVTEVNNIKMHKQGYNMFLNAMTSVI